MISIVYHSWTKILILPGFFSINFIRDLATYSCSDSWIMFPRGFRGSFLGVCSGGFLEESLFNMFAEICRTNAWREEINAFFFQRSSIHYKNQITAPSTNTKPIDSAIVIQMWQNFHWFSFFDLNSLLVHLRYASPFIELKSIHSWIQRFFQTFIIDESNNSFKTWMVFDPTCCDLVGKRVNLQDPDLARFHRGLLRLKAVSKSPSPRRLEAAQEQPRCRCRSKACIFVGYGTWILLRYFCIFLLRLAVLPLWVCTFFWSPNRTVDATDKAASHQGRLLCLCNVALTCLSRVLGLLGFGATLNENHPWRQRLGLFVTVIIINSH